VTNSLSRTPKQKFFTNNGAPAAGYKLFTYQAGTSTKLATYQGPTTGSPNANPIVLNFRGECDLWTPPNVAYKYVLAPPTDTDPPTSPIWTVDSIVDSQLITLYGGVDTGVANAYVLTFVANFSAYADGVLINWIPSNTNTLGSTINVNGLGPIAILNQDGSGLIYGQIQPNTVQTIMYKGGSFLLLTPQKQTFFAGISTGTVNNYSLTAPLFSTVPGTLLYFAPNITNTGDVTLTVNGRALAVRNVDGSILSAGQLQANKTAGVVVNDSFYFTLVSTVTAPLLISSGTFTPTWFGFSVNPVGDLSWYKIANICFLYTTASRFGTSNSTSFEITNCPLEIFPAGLDVPVMVQDNGAIAAGMIGRTGLSTLQFYKGTAPPSLTGFTAAASKGLPAGFMAMWSL
jgi:hypothetical protein